jgi:hypothetical protein
MNKKFNGGLFPKRGKPQPLAESAKSRNTVIPEKLIQKAFIGWRDLFKRQYPILNAIFSVPNGAMLPNKAIAVSQIKQGLTSGIQDVICLAPAHDRSSYGLLIEFKTEAASSKQSDEQVYFHNFFAALGYRTEVCRSAYAASMLVNEHLNIKVPVYPR